MILHGLPQNSLVDNLPGDELPDGLKCFLAPALEHLSEKRLRDVAKSL
jgi:hypothetical protein